MNGPSKLGAGLLVGSVLAFLASQVIVFALSRNAYFFCVDQEPPRGALTGGEGSSAGFDIVQLPVGGVNCWWLAPGDGILTTFHPDLLLAAVTYAALGMLLAGIVLISLGVRRNFLRALRSVDGGGA